MRSRYYVWFVLSVFSFSVQAAAVDETWKGLIASGNSAFHQNKLDEALVYFEKSLNAAGEDPELLALSNHDMGMVYQLRGELNRAEFFYGRAVGYWEKLPVTAVDFAAATYNNFGDLLTDKHQFVRAQGMYAKALALWKESKTAKPSRIAFAMSKLAACYNLNGQAALAESMLNEAIALLRSLPDPDPVDLAASLDCLAKVYSYQHQFQKAEPLFHEAVSLMERVAGNRDPTYAVSLHNLATMHRIAGNSDRAEPLLRKAESIYAEVLGPRHPYLVLIWNEQGLIALGEKKYSLALSHMERAYDLTKEVYGPTHVRTTFAKGNVALVHIRSGKLDSGKKMMMEVLAESRNSPDIAPEEYARTLTNCAEVFMLSGDPKQAEAYFREAIPIWRSSHRNPTGLADALKGYARVLKINHNPEARKVEKEVKAFLATNGR
jgi:tetratricopeptide (TPR) repeat protein